MRRAERTIAFITTAVAAAKPRAGRRTEYRVRDARTTTALRGLVLDVRPNGAKSWHVHYDVRHHGKRVRRKAIIGDGLTALETVRARWREVREAVDAGRDWLAEADAKAKAAERDRAARITFAALAADYMRLHSARRKRTSGDDANKLARYILPAIGHLPVADIAKRDVMQLLEGVAVREERPAPVHADRIKTLLCSIFSWAIKTGRADANPARGIAPFAEKRRRTRVYSQAELRALWPRLEAEQPNVATWQALAVFRLAILTGQRLSQIARARKGEFAGLGTGTAAWHIPGERNKNREAVHIVPICPMAEAVIREAMSRAGESEYLFPSSRSGRPIDRGTVHERAMTACRKAGIEGVVVHDARRTLKTALAMLRVDRDVRDRLTGHRSGTGSMSEWYDVHDYLDDMRAALARWERHLAAVIEGRDDGANVVPLRA